jgi:hypothetical protein
MHVNVRPNAMSTLNCVLCPLLAVSCGDAGLALFTLTVSAPQMDYSWYISYCVRLFARTFEFETRLFIYVFVLYLTMVFVTH